MRCWYLYSQKHSCMWAHSSLSSLPNRFRFEGWESLNGAFYHPEESFSLLALCSLVSSSTLPVTTSFGDHPMVSATLSFVLKLLQFVCYYYSSFIYESCVLRCPPFITTPFLSVLFLALTHQIKTQNRRWRTSGPGCRALARRETPRDKVRVFFPLHKTLLWDVQRFRSL